MTPEAQLKKKRLMKLNPRAHIGYLVRYDSTNIYRIWIPHKGTVISTRDVIFDEKTFFNGKHANLQDELIAELDTLIERIMLPEAQTRNEALLQEDDEALDLTTAEADSESDNEPIQDFNHTEDLELAKALEEAYLTPPETDNEDNESPCALYTPYPYERKGGASTDYSAPGTFPEPTQSHLQEAFKQEQRERFTDFTPEPITSVFHGTFAAGRKIDGSH
jgi:hypothetical protein